ncbi:lysophospholipid acyltransferase family protein [Pelagovum pacificum]|uniref:1-acyl-sn-glycerol-3-phosphate acyltransferase n=1 Tax=Pelagovum pacificum TaxID=2588711 RepID=A0A5C5G9Z1_9RHOB|nr:lysophospholipid acyltransferase family protein [Pelagovum pacificum]QQA42399.1 1-acyl-sn-glycerol-3-phosphate acyltransferase [Pelagovum pacificum]TNY31481.1 1-acyl-sn-glycerol-3-phosphate acyltransferase [Pelagovum pacificum]
MNPIQWIRSLLFVIQMYVAMAVLGIVFFPYALATKEGAFRAARAYTRWVRWTARWMIGLKTEVRGTPPSGEVLIAAKHQSFLDIILIFGSLPHPKFIMKRELVYTPVLGQYTLRMGCIPVDRGKRAQAVKKMVADVAAGHADPGQLVIYPQGTRIAPGVTAPYKIGAAALYDAMGKSCVPVACNVGLFWPRAGIYRKPGTAVIEYLDPIEPGLTSAEFLGELSRVVEQRSNMLMAEAGFAPIGEEEDR